MSVITLTSACPPRLSLRVSEALLKQQQTFDKSWPQCLSPNGSLSPNLQPPTPPILSINQKPTVELPSIFADKYIITEQIETSNLYKCIDKNTCSEFCCKVSIAIFDYICIILFCFMYNWVKRLCCKCSVCVLRVLTCVTQFLTYCYVRQIVATKHYDHFLRAHLRVDGHRGINNIEAVFVGKSQTFILFSPSFGDLHSYVRSKKRLRESEAMHLFHQIATVVADCHNNGIILRDLKLRKFIFSNKEK